MIVPEPPLPRPQDEDDLVEGEVLEDVVEEEEEVELLEANSEFLTSRSVRKLSMNVCFVSFHIPWSVDVTLYM